MTAWAKSAIWWSVYPLGAVGAPIRREDGDGTGWGSKVHHRLPRLLCWLDELVRLGCNGLALGPVWASAAHGYDVIDHLRIDPRLGDDEDFDALVTACHARGIRVLLDGVFNHVSAQHPFVLSDREMLRRDDHDAEGLARFEGHSELVELDHANPAVADYVMDVMNHWLDRGADGWRLDAAYRVPASFWAGVLPRVRTDHPEAFVLAEILHGDYAALAREAGFDSVTQYELWKACWSALKDRNPHELLWALQRHDTMTNGMLPWTFVGNHDVTRIASQVGAKAARVALGVIMTLAGTPALYYGDEWGQEGVKTERVGGDDDIRPVLPATPPQWRGEAGETFRLTQLAIRVRRTNPWLAHGRTEIIACGHEQLTWRTRGPGGEWVEARLDVSGGEPSLRISGEPGELLVL